jgi:hypothetical protein
MRVEPIAVGCYAHDIKRGGHGMPITRDLSDKYRFSKSLFFLNDSFFDKDWPCFGKRNHSKAEGNGNSQTIPIIGNSLTVPDNVPDILNADIPIIGTDKLFYRPSEWPERQPLVKILAYCLMPNHLHLLLKEIVDGGISFFMKKLGQSMSNHFNEKYDTIGSIFQGSYKGKTIKQDEYLKILAVYIMVKNPFELYPKGYAAALKNFEDAWQWALQYPFSSLPDYASKRKSPIIDKDILGEIFETPGEFKSFAKDYMLWKAEQFGAVALK